MRCLLASPFIFFTIFLVILSNVSILPCDDTHLFVVVVGDGNGDLWQLWKWWHFRWDMLCL